MARKKLVGSVLVPGGRLLQPQEMVVATILSWNGEPVRFLSEQNTVTADIIYQGLQWEIKSPRGSSRHTIENNIRLALRQSPNIIIDLQLIKITDRKCLGYIKQQINLRHQIKHLIVVTKKQEVLSLK